MGADVSGGVDVMAADIGRHTFTVRELSDALYRCRVEIRGTGGFAPRLTTPEILERLGVVVGVEADLLEAVAAWDVVVQVAGKHARMVDDRWVLARHSTKANPECENCGGYGLIVVQRGDGSRTAKECDCRSITPPPDLPARSLDTVQRMGGWGTFKDIETKTDGKGRHTFTFVRRDFLAEYARWRRVEEHRLALGAGSQARLGNGLSRPDFSGIRKMLA